MIWSGKGSLWRQSGGRIGLASPGEAPGSNNKNTYLIGTASWYTSPIPETRCPRLRQLVNDDRSKTHTHTWNQHKSTQPPPSPPPPPHTPCRAGGGRGKRASSPEKRKAKTQTAVVPPGPQTCNRSLQIPHTKGHT